MKNLYSATFLWVVYFLTTFVQISESLAAPIIRDVFVFSECEKRAQIRVRNGVAPYTYVWSFGGEIIQTDAALSESAFSTIEQAKAGDYTLTVTDNVGNTYSEVINFKGSTNFILNILYEESQACAGESFGIVYGTIENGIPPFTINFYDESNTIVQTNVISGRNIDLSGVPAGKYLVEVIDATGCKELTEIEIEEIEPLVLTPAAGVGTFPETCIENGGITFDATGFVGTVQFRIRRSDGTYVTGWLPAPGGQISYNQLAEGDYVLEIIDQFRLEDCPEELVFNIGNEILLEAIPTAEGVTCFGGTDGTIKIDINRLFMGFTFPPATATVTITRPNGSIAVNEESISIGATSGTRTFTDFGPGVHTITIKHGGADYPECTLNYTINVPSPPTALTGSVTTNTVTCFGQNNGSATVNRSGGWGGYKYLWSTGQTTRTVTNLAPGNYTVRLSDREGCFIDLNVTITGPPAPITGDIELLNGLACAGSNDGSARVFNISGGWGGYTYLWSNGETTTTAFNLPAGTNTVKVRDNKGCEVEFSVVVPVPDAPAVTYTPVNPICFGGNDGSIRVQIADNVLSFSVTANGETKSGTDVTFTNLPAGQYEVVVSYGLNCNITEFVDVINPPGITINENNLIINNLLCAGDGNGSITGLTASGGTGTLAYQWQKAVLGNFEDLNAQTSLDIFNLTGGIYKLIVTDQNGCTVSKEYTVIEPLPLEVTPPVVIDVACFGELTGSVSFTVSGGTAPYSYSLNGGAFTTTSIGAITIGGLGASTNNFVEIRDANGCVVPNLNFDVTSLPVITISNVTINPEVCFGQNNGGISIDIAGGTGNLGVNWFEAGNFSTIISTDQNLTNVAPGQYTVKVFDLGNNGCFVQQTFIIPPTPELELDLDGVVNILCFGESTGGVNIAVSGGTGAYTYSWTGPSGYTSTSQDISAIPAGLYNVTVTDANGCFKELKDILVSQPLSGIVVSLLNVVDPKCHDSTDGRIEIQIAGGNPAYSLRWEKESSPGIFTPISGTSQTLSNIGEGTYKVIVTDANLCSSELVVNVNAPDPLLVSLVSKDEVSCFGRNDGRITINVTGGTGIYFFAWDHGFINQNPNNLAAGLYSVTVTDANGCSFRLENIEITQPDPLEINLVSISAPTCAYTDGSIEVAYVGWVPGLSYNRWIDLSTNTQIAENVTTVSGLKPGFYRVEYSLAGACMVTQTYNVPGPRNPLQLFTNPQDASCPGESGILFLSAFGGVPSYTYSIFLGGVWQTITNSILSGLTIGTYDVKVTDAAGCEDFSTITINEPNPPVFDAQVEKDVSCFGGNDGVIRFEVSGNTTGITVQWYRRNNFGGKIPITEANLGSLIAGTYFMEITYAGGCMIDSPDYVIVEPDEILITQAVLQPICEGEFGSFGITFVGGSPGKTLTVTSINGYSKTYSNQDSGTFDFEELLPGDYVWTIGDTGCPDITGNFTIISPVKPDFNINSQDVSCFGANDGIIEILSPIVQGGRTYTVYINGVSQGVQTTFFDVAPGNYQIRIVDNLGCQSDPQLVIITQPERPLEITNLVVQNANCFGSSTGSINFEILGGRPVYRATLTPVSGPTQTLTNLNQNTVYSFAALAAGNYTLEVWDINNVCQVSELVTISQPNNFTVSANSGTILCFGGNTFIELSPVGGTEPYTFVWEKFNTGTSTWETLSETSKRLSNAVAGQYRYSVQEANGCAAVSDTIIIPDGSAVTVTFVADPILCYGESALVTLQASSGSFTNFTYFVNGNQIFGNTFQAKAGNYLVYAIDNVRGCISADVNISIAQPAAPLSILDYSSSNLSCFESGDGSISLSLTGGTAPYTITFGGLDYSANENQVLVFNNLDALVAYTFTAVDANGCAIAIPPKTLAQPLPLQASATSMDILCFGGTSEISLQITGGTRPYSISWSYSIDNTTFTPIPASTNFTTITGLVAGFYTYTVSDGGCADVVETIQIEEPSKVILDAVTTDVSCFGGSDGTVVFTPSGGAFATYRIFFNGVEISGNSVSGLTAGIYNAFTINGTCKSDVIQVIIGQPAQPLTVLVDNLDEVLCFGDLSDINLSISGGNGSYLAYLNGVEYTVDPSGDISFIDLSPGTYNLRVIDAKGCEWASVVTVADTTPIEIFQDEIIGISCFGSSDGEIKVSITGGTGSFTYRWLNASSQIVGTNQDLSGVPAGVYTLVVTDENNCEATMDFVIGDTTPVSFTSSFTDITCFGSQNGSITVVGSGGKPGYTLVIDGIQYPGLTANGLRPNIYNVYVLDANGCASPTTQITINQPTPLTLTVNKANVSCFNQNNGTAEAVFAGGTAPYTIRWSDGNTQATRTGLAPGNYEVVITDANGCIARSNVIITQPAPILVVETINPVSCFGGSDGSISLAISGGNGSFTVNWINKVSGASVGTGNIVNNLPEGIYVATIRDPFGCESIREYTITQPAEPLSISPIISHVRCSGENNGNIDLIIAGGTGPYTYEWSSGETTRAINGKAGGTYTVNVRDSKGCIVSQTFVIDEPLPIEISLESTQNVSCKFGNDGRIKINITGGTGIYTIQWSNGMSGTEISGLRAGDYTVFVIDENSCLQSATYTITEPAAALAVSAIISTELCEFDQLIELNLTVTGGTAPYTFAWSNGATSQNLIGITPGNYSVTVTDSKGCSVNETFTVPPPTSPMEIDLEGKFAVCTNGERGEIIATVTGGLAPYTYQWSNGATSSTVTDLLPGSYTLVVTDAKGCTVSETIEIARPLNLRISLINIKAVSCFSGMDGLIEIGITGGKAPYKINWSNGLEGQLAATNLAAGTYNVTVEDALGCIVTGTYNIREPELLSFRETVENSKCAGSNNGVITLNVFGGAAPYTYRWSNGANSRVIRNLAPDTYNVLITDRNGCVTGGTFVVSEPDPIVIESNHSEMLDCFGDENGFISLDVRGGIQPYRIKWADTPIETLSRSNLPAGTYNVSITDDNGCIENKTFEIRQPDLLEVRLFTRFDVNCETRELTGVAWLVIKGGTPDYRIEWNTGSSNVEETNFYEDGEITAIVTDRNGCLVEVSKEVTMPIAFTDAAFTYTVISIGVQGEILVNEPVQFNDATLGQVIAWEWDFGDGTKSNEQNPVHTFTKIGKYTISLKTFDALGCVSETKMEIEVFGSYRILVPNAFTPNGDGLNDTFIPKMRGIEDFELHIFNKWGELVYSAFSKEDAGWDGTLNGKMSPNGNYVYKIIFKAVDGEKGSQTGVFTLVL
ncbi:gliding motility-associated C-terminal domain-containing protein [Aquiflexum sp. LQ15W]|uniref:T9SS type B sorting domain-containing protein n=1 Tax=Cognataquiflexum nitidum TaxID=2922272 RepID=UPI001F130E58|nr:gliding motility-associated C-terminal domain-containing protein [Cognataquiflexum nitidum]MCH6198981.1 gliding motility-associated C-terminal domain-containing protein [Cognataquiflexum nitidum]